MNNPMSYHTVQAGAEQRLHDHNIQLGMPIELEVIFEVTP